MMTGNDDAARAREDSFLGELIPQVTEHLAAQRAGEFDAEAGRARFVTWLTAHTKEPAARAKGRLAAAHRQRRPSARMPPLRLTGRCVPCSRWTSPGSPARTATMTFAST